MAFASGTLQERRRLASPNLEAIPVVSLAGYDIPPAVHDKAATEKLRISTLAVIDDNHPAFFPPEFDAEITGEDDVFILIESDCESESPASLPSPSAPPLSRTTSTYDGYGYPDVSNHTFCNHCNSYVHNDLLPKHARETSSGKWCGNCNLSNFDVEVPTFTFDTNFRVPCDSCEKETPYKDTEIFARKGYSLRLCLDCMSNAV